jgi:hypothetical protein
MLSLTAIFDYFDLRVDKSDSPRGADRRAVTRHPGKPKRGAWWWNLVIYLAAVGGVAGKFVFDYWRRARPFAWDLDLPISLIIGALVLPIVYKSTDMSPDKPEEILQYFLAFQNGFFWQTLIGGLLRDG